VILINRNGRYGYYEILDFRSKIQKCKNVCLRIFDFGDSFLDYKRCYFPGGSVSPYSTEVLGFQGGALKIWHGGAGFHERSPLEYHNDEYDLVLGSR
jgi:hypothetical protein